MAQRKEWQKWRPELEQAKSVLKDYEGEIELWENPDQYIAFKFKAPDYTIVFYPHQTSARHRHLRIRLEAPKGKPLNRFKASEVMWKLTKLENSCTFSVLNNHRTYSEEAFREGVIRGR